MRYFTDGECLLSPSGVVSKDGWLYYWTNNNLGFYCTNIESGQTKLLEIYDSSKWISGNIVFRPGVHYDNKIIFAPARCGHIMSYDCDENIITYYDIGFKGEYTGIIPYDGWLYFIGNEKNILRFNHNMGKAQRLKEFSECNAIYGYGSWGDMIYALSDNGNSIYELNLKKMSTRTIDVHKKNSKSCCFCASAGCFWIGKEDGKILCVNDAGEIIEEYDINNCLKSYDEYSYMEKLYAIKDIGDFILISTRRYNKCFSIDKKEHIINAFDLSEGERCGSGGFFEINNKRIGMAVEKADSRPLYDATDFIIIDKNGNIEKNKLLGVKDKAMLVPGFIENNTNRLDYFLCHISNQEEIRNSLVRCVNETIRVEEI